MKSYRVKNMMAPLSEYAKISESSSLLEAIKALRKEQDVFGRDQYKNRAILVFDKDNHFVGKLSEHDVIEALEPNYKDMRGSMDRGYINHLGFSEEFVKSTREQYNMWEKSLENLCEKASQLEVKSIMYIPDWGEFVGESTTMDEAIHQLVIGRHHSLLVTDSHDTREIVGVLRLADVFEFVGNSMLEFIPEHQHQKRLWETPCKDDTDGKGIDQLR